MAYVFEWDSAKAVAHPSTVFGDPLALLMPDPDHSEGAARYTIHLLGMSAKQPDQSGGDMKRRRRGGRGADLDTLRPEYDFSGAVRGATAARYARGANIVVVDPKVLDVFPDGASVNEALRALAPVIRRGRRGARRRRSA